MGAPRRAVALATIAFLTLVWGTTWAGIRIALVGFPPFTAVAVRFAVAALLFVGYARVTGVSLRPRNRIELRLWVLDAALSFCVS